MKSNTSKYRYDRVTMGILISDFAFNKGSAAPGDLFPDFKVASTDGEVKARRVLRGGRRRSMKFQLSFSNSICTNTRLS